MFAFLERALRVKMYASNDFAVDEHMALHHWLYGLVEASGSRICYLIRSRCENGVRFDETRAKRRLKLVWSSVLMSYIECSQKHRRAIY
jgi:hypothetical protein